MRILQVIDEPWDSGVVHYALTLGSALEGAGHGVRVWAGRTAAPFEAAGRLGLDVRDGARPWLRFWSLRRELLREPVDVINAHTGSAHTLAVLLAATLPSPPRIVRTWADARRPDPRAGRGWLVRRTHGFIAANETILRAFQAMNLPSHLQSCVIRQGLDPSGLPSQGREPSGPVVVGVAARLDPVKGHEDILRAAERVLREKGDVRFRIAGNPASWSAAELQRRAEGMGLGGAVRYLGRVPDIAAFMRTCHIGLVGSTASEAVSRAALEWMAAGVPVVATRVGCLPEIIRDGMTGYLVNPGDSETMALRLVELAADSRLRGRLGTEARRRFLEKHTAELFAAETLEFYRSLPTLSPAPAPLPALRIFHLDGERGLRGAETKLLDLACGLARRGHENVVVCRAGSALETQARAAGLKTLALPFLGEWDLYSAWRLKREVAAQGGQDRRNVLHAHTGHSAALARLARGLGAKASVVVGREVHFPVSSGLSLKWKYGSADRIVAVSDSVKAQLVRDGADPSRILTVYPALDPDRLRALGGMRREDLRRELAAKWDLPPDALWIGNLAALVGHKDQATLLAAMRQAADRFPQVRLLIAGEGPLEADLREQTRRLGLVEHVRFLGFVPAPLKILKAVDLFALSSSGEAFGIVLLEAMACGLPIVATRVGGIPEALRDQAEGLLVPPGDPRALADALCRLLGDPNLARSLGEKGRERAKDFSLERLAGGMEEAYRC